MLAKTMKWGLIAGLLLAAISWNAGANFRLLLDMVVLVGAIMVVRQASLAKQYFWAAGFVGAALLLNPVVPVLTPAGNLMLLLFLVALSPIVVTFAALLDARITLHPTPITDSYVQGEALRPTREWAVV
ncbi:MAG TPA: hypothetical protein VNH83_22220 [Bryobacteraceae bacterium]|nr:hypothetical protein [Bryobacteraceae bacterium]